MNDVSVIIPCYNQSEFIKETIDSVLNQEGNYNIEIIVVNDCSTDSSLDIIKRYESVILVDLKENSKLPAVRNRGIEKASGKYIVCLDGDDKLQSNYISENIKTMEYFNVDISYTPSQCFGSNTNRYNWIDFNADVLRANNYIHASAMFKQEIFEVVGGYDEELVYGWEDYSFWLKALAKGYKFKRCITTELLWRQHDSPTQMTQSVTKNNEEQIKQQLKKLHGDFYLGV
tara:strand:+ start:7170 stop:7859 length:690 start_codon:yes stop_codon:yes gene_type:complete